MSDLSQNGSKPLGSIRLDCEARSVVSIGLLRALQGQANVYFGSQAPKGESYSEPAIFILCSDDADSVSGRIKRIKEAQPKATVLVFGLGVDLPLARAGLRAGARGFIHAGMSPEQLMRAVEVAAEGELVAPRRLLEYLLANDERADLNVLSARQKEILGFVVQGMSNLEIGKRLYLSESTIKQHLRAAYKVLGVRNRTEAAKLIRDAT